MPTRKIADLPTICRDSEHNPPTHMVYEPGVYEHECPSCRKKTVFHVSNPIFSAMCIADSFRS